MADLTEQLLEQGPGQGVPGDGVSDGREDPVELPQGGLAVRLLAGDAVDQVPSQPLAAEQALGTEPAQGHLQSKPHFRQGTGT